VTVAACAAALAFGVAALPAAAPRVPSFAAPHAYPTGNGPLSIAIGDVNGDGRPDLASSSRA
jgi:hypothetical protein